MIAIAFVITFLAGLGAGYALGWNQGLHPGKVEGQASAIGQKIDDAVQSVKNRNQ